MVDMPKRYVVRGNSGDAPFVVVVDDLGNEKIVYCDWRNGDRGSPTKFDTLNDAFRAKRNALKQHPDVWMCVILPEGIEVSLSSYGEVIEEIEAGHAALDPIVPRLDAKTNTPLLLSARAALAANQLRDLTSQVEVVARKAWSSPVTSVPSPTTDWQTVATELRLRATAFQESTTARYALIATAEVFEARAKACPTTKDEQGTADESDAPGITPETAPDPLDMWADHCKGERLHPDLKAGFLRGVHAERERTIATKYDRSVSDDEHATAARWAGVYHGCDFSKAPVVLREQAITNMLPLVREARAWQAEAQVQNVTRLAPLTEAEALDLAHTWYDSHTGGKFFNNESLAALLMSVSRGDIPAEVRAVPLSEAEDAEWARAAEKADKLLLDMPEKWKNYAASRNNVQPEVRATSAPTTTKGGDGISNAAIDKMLDARQAILGVCAALEKIDATSFQRAAEGVAATREAVCEALSLCDPRPVLLTEADVDDVARYAWGAKEIRTPSPDAWVAVPEAERVGWRAVARTIDIRLRHFSRRATTPASGKVVARRKVTGDADVPTEWGDDGFCPSCGRAGPNVKLEGPSPGHAAGCAFVAFSVNDPRSEEPAKPGHEWRYDEQCEEWCQVPVKGGAS